VRVTPKLPSLTPKTGNGRSEQHGRYNIGLLNMQTEGVLGIAPGNNYTVARLAREFGRRSSVGVIAINKSPTGTRADLYQSNQTYGLDANIGVGSHLTLFNYAAKTRTPGRDGRD